MSARVFNPLVMSEMRRMIGRSSSDGSGTTAAVARVRRDLFGPVNREDAQLFVEKELAAISKRETERWGFDFVKETPVETTRFKWERVSPEENIPEAYALRRLSSFSHAGSPSSKRDASTNTSTTQSTTTPKVKSSIKQSQITDYLKCRKRSLSMGDLSLRKIGSADREISSRKLGSPAAIAAVPHAHAHARSELEPSSKRQRQ